MLTPDLALLKSSCYFCDALKKAKFVLSHHNLLQTESQGLAFFSGKTPEHTWRKDLSERFKKYMEIYLHDRKAVANIFGEDEQIPSTIPFYLKAITVKSLNHTATAIAIYVGKLHFGITSTLISKVPFEDLELVPLSLKRQNKETFDQQVQLHKFLCQDSAAIKLRNTSSEFREQFKIGMKANDKVSEHIIDVAEAASTQKDGTLYIQYLTPHKDLVLNSVNEYISKYISEHPGDEVPECLTKTTHSSTNSTSKTQTVNTLTTRFHNYLADKHASTPAQKSQKSNVPGAISYSEMATGAYHNSVDPTQPQSNSAISSPTNS